MALLKVENGRTIFFDLHHSQWTKTSNNKGRSCVYPRGCQKGNATQWVVLPSRPLCPGHRSGSETRIVRVDSTSARGPSLNLVAPCSELLSTPPPVLDQPTCSYIRITSLITASAASSPGSWSNDTRPGPLQTTARVEGPGRLTSCISKHVYLGFLNWGGKYRWFAICSCLNPKG